MQCIVNLPRREGDSHALHTYNLLLSRLLWLGVAFNRISFSHQCITKQACMEAIWEVIHRQTIRLLNLLLCICTLGNSIPFLLHEHYYLTY